MIIQNIARELAFAHAEVSAMRRCGYRPSARRYLRAYETAPQTLRRIASARASIPMGDPPTDARLMQNGKPSLLLPERPLPDLAPVLVDVIFETIERICEQTTPSSFWNSMPSPPLEIADYLCVREFGKLNMLGEAPKLLEDSFVTAANLEGHW